MKSKRPRRPMALLAVIPNTECPSPGPGVRLQRGQSDYRDLHYPGCSRSHANDDVTSNYHIDDVLYILGPRQ